MAMLIAENPHNKKNDPAITVGQLREMLGEHDPNLPIYGFLLETGELLPIRVNAVEFASNPKTGHRVDINL